HRDGRVPQAGAGRHQPGGTANDGTDPRHRSGAAASRGSAEGSGTVSLASASALLVPGAISAPHIEYGQLSPMLVVFGVAVAGVLVEALVPRPYRRPAHLVLTLGGLVVAFILTVVVASSTSLFGGHAPGNIAAEGAVAVDRPTLFIQGT